MIDEKKITEAEKLLYSLSAIKDILKMLECDVEVTMTLKMVIQKLLIVTKKLKNVLLTS